MLKNNKLEAVRKDKRMTNRAFAEFIGIGETAYSKLKKGVLPTGEQTINKIETALPEYNIDWLLYGIEPKESKYKSIEREFPINQQNIEQPNEKEQINMLREQINLLNKTIERLEKQNDQMQKHNDQIQKHNDQLYETVVFLQDDVKRMQSQLASAGISPKEKSA